MESDQLGKREISNKVLWSRLREGKKQALGKIFNRYFDSLYSYGYRIIPNKEKIRDAIQEVFFQLWKYRHNLSEVKSVRAYLFVSLRRELLKDKAVQLRREKLDKDYTSEEFEVFIDYEKWIEILELEDEKRHSLKQALKKLTPRQREAIYLKYYEGLTTRELSKVMDIHTQSIYNLLVDAVKKLRTLLDAVD